MYFHINWKRLRSGVRDKARRCDALPSSKSYMMIQRTLAKCAATAFVSSSHTQIRYRGKSSVHHYRRENLLIAFYEAFNSRRWGKRIVNESKKVSMRHHLLQYFYSFIVCARLERQESVETVKDDSLLFNYFHTQLFRAKAHTSLEQSEGKSRRQASSPMPINHAGIFCIIKVPTTLNSALDVATRHPSS